MQFLGVLVVIAITALFMMVFLLPQDHPLPSKVNAFNNEKVIPFFLQK